MHQIRFVLQNHALRNTQQTVGMFSYVNQSLTAGMHFICNSRYNTHGVRATAMHQAACALTLSAVAVLWFAGRRLASGTTLILADQTQRSWRTRSTSWTVFGFPSGPSWGREATSSQSKHVLCVTRDCIAGCRQRNGRTPIRASRRRVRASCRPTWPWVTAFGTTLALLCSRGPTLLLSKATNCVCACVTNSYCRLKPKSWHIVWKFLLFMRKQCHYRRDAEVCFMDDRQMTNTNCTFLICVYEIRMFVIRRRLFHPGW
jgi:hypothetical protein